MSKEKMMRALILLAAVAVAVVNTVPLAAQTDARVSDLERKVDALAGEIERLKLGEAAEPELVSVNGLGPAASKVYGKAPKRVSIGGYGEMSYQNYRGRKQDDATAGKRDAADFVRAVLYAGYKFNDWIAFNSETEFEHATDSKRGEVSVEMAALDFTPWGSPLGLRAGLLLMPVGLSNEIHEPTTYHGVNRPSVEANLIPTTWRENGVGLFGEAGPFRYRSYLVTGLQAVSDTNVTGFKGDKGLRDGRSSGSKSYAEDLAWVGRIDAAPAAGASFGGSLYVGEADQRQLNAPQVPVTLWELHAQGRWRGAEVKALYTEVRIGNVAQLNAAQGFTGNKSVGSELFGGYVEAAYDVFSVWSGNRGQSLAPFFRYERYDTQKTVPDGYTKDPANSRIEYTLGLTYKPIAQVAVKFDHQVMRNQARTGVGQTNLGIGYIF
jgi:hypothetical protein